MRSRKQLIQHLIVLTVLVLGQGIYCSADSYAQADKPQPFSGIVIESEDATPFQINALIEKIDTGLKPSMVVGEALIVITTYKYEGKIHQPNLLNIEGNPIKIYDFKVGQRVKVFGFQLPDKMIVGHRIQVKKAMKSDPQP